MLSAQTVADPNALRGKHGKEAAIPGRDLAQAAQGVHADNPNARPYGLDSPAENLVPS